MEREFEIALTKEQHELGTFRLRQTSWRLRSRSNRTEFICEKIRKHIKEGKLYRVDMKEMDTVNVKGKDIPVKIYGIFSAHRKQ